MRKAAKINLSPSNLASIDHWFSQRGFESRTPDASAAGVFICNIDQSAHTLLVGFGENCQEVTSMLARLSEALGVSTSIIMVKSPTSVNLTGSVRMHRNLRRLILFGVEPSECVIESFLGQLEIVKTYDLESLKKNPGLKKELWEKVRPPISN